ncbi:hypothetical protein PHYSODRAFT_327665 [Phytophthora sojae]|uniref:Uncharacterized protein n=1 Tax=Phytophthora sojae (strain P6497) TaxID=1094619 RepID=G4Z493_PHYSP|nr:hypothetical protein PHYSODRAFT_327665 [Phytophthora sojae]EGZ19399.1 hypothetical protein PHYSODRAFT_327665 [Phytophthora sojae]|eukprot:XP_009522116.1 hypothetical protein PHYSODRAFT_327665 [Phytophthora sojae]
MSMNEHHTGDHFQIRFQRHKPAPTSIMQKASFFAALVLAITGPAIFAAGQESTKAALFLGSSQDLADSVICLSGQSTCRSLRELEGEAEDLANYSILKPLNETSGDKEMVCFGPCCARCYQYRSRRLEEVVDEHRRLEVSGKSQVQEIACVNEPWGLQCN